MFVISGVTGNTGSVVAQNLIDAGKDIRVLVRSKEKGKKWKDQGAEVAIADLSDASSLEKALEGAQAAFLLLPPDLANTDYMNNSAKMADTLLQAVERNNTPHVVFLSSVGAQHDEKNGAIGTIAYLERLFEKSHIKSTAVRAAYFFENWLDVLPAVLNDSVLPSFIHPLDRKLDMVATQDIGETIAEAMLNPNDANHHLIELKGVQQYSAIDVAQALSKALKKDVTPVEIPKVDWVPALVHEGLSESVAHTFVGMFENINNGFLDFTQQNVKHGKINLEEYINKAVA